MSKIEAMDCAIELTYKTGVPQPLRDTSTHAILARIEEIAIQ